ncbi:glycosyltransferase family 2 protein [Microbacterium sp. ZXX196]|uniref:glycosyltransferase family 2 protein n=1 Tax=Microbacterium sp. ZXX196 TaxID=2609291 RepID=UPI0012B88A05|nr:glycosyltransferase family 2 protein [Microbacterium sp. ZXX196]MTE22728.1 glycosyltransferase [Microbacterium sp. ZXX196]
MRESSGAPGAPLVSVVVPTHDVAPWLRQSLESILAQRVDMEVLVVDDRSTDETVDIARAFAARDERVTVHAAETPGGGSARNAGARLARGRYLIFADGDDLIPDGAYAALVGSLERTGSDMAVGDYIKFRAVDTWRPTAAMPAFAHHRSGITLADEPTLLYSRPCWNKAYRREFWEASGIAFPDVPRSNDIVPMVSALVGAASIDIIPDVVYVYRERPGAGSMTARAGASTSLVSYLTQETACAQLVRAERSAELDRVYANLVWDRDGFQAVAKFLAAWEPGEGDVAVSEQLARLLAATGWPGANVHPLRRLALELAASGRLAAAAVAASAAEGSPAPPAALAGFVDLASDDPTAGVPAPERSVIAERFARQFATRASDPAWQEAAALATEAWGPRATLFSPDPRGEGAAREAGRLTRVAGGPLLVVEGRGQEPSLAPALFDGEASIAEGGARVIDPVSVTWTGEDAWSAVYPVAALPLHRPLTPVVRAPGGECVPVPGEPPIPPYAPRDAFLYDVQDGILVVRRRRHWIPRAARRAAILARARLRR